MPYSVTYSARTIFPRMICGEIFPSKKSGNFDRTEISIRNIPIILCEEIFYWESWILNTPGVIMKR